ncbi:MFS transporter [Herbaspirillum lusitanum]|uniref:MFS transporter n=1 Tax=Herbaspirillum lusitanum TaxID=213312 RepID=A0ABW9AJ51_9BURK
MTASRDGAEPPPTPDSSLPAAGLAVPAQHARSPRDSTAAFIVALGVAQIVAWGSTVFLAAVIATPMSTGLGITRGTFFAAFSLSLIVMALCGPRVGRNIDRTGGRSIMLVSSFILAAGLLLLAAVQGTVTLFAAWIVIGVGMALGLYDSAFAAVVHRFRQSARNVIVGVTVVAGFTSTIGWPFSIWLIEHFGWRICCVVWALLNVAIAWPIYLYFINPRRYAKPAVAPIGIAATEVQVVAASGETAAAEAPAAALAAVAEQAQRPRRDLYLLCIFSGATSFVSSAMAAHLPGLLEATGATTVQILMAGMLLGPAQVVSRLLEFGLARRFDFHPLASARLATALHPIACALLAAAPPFAALTSTFAVIHGAGNGMISVARGVLPLSLFGAQAYGAITGTLAIFGRSMQACAPFLFALVLESLGVGWAMLLSSGLSIAASFSLLALRARR